MFSRVLETLKTDTFATRFAFISNPNAVHQALQRCEEVENLRLAILSGEITEGTLRSFTTSLLNDLKPGHVAKPLAQANSVE